MLGVTKALYPALSMCDLIFSGLCERHLGLKIMNGARRDTLMPPYRTASMGKDLLRRDRSEPPWFAGKAVEVNLRDGIATPG
jgi:hypothetical protein